MPGYGHFLVEKWLLTGERTSAWSIELPWFPRDGEWRSFKPGGPDPSPQVTGLAEGPENRLWIVAIVANPNWRKTITTWRRTEGVVVPVVEDWGDVYDTMVVLLDTRTGRVQATQRFDGTFRTLAGPGMLTRYVIDDSGKTTLEIHKLALRAPTGRDP
jgi:hypothetical protein